jgi:hypothetical protein
MCPFCHTQALKSYRSELAKYSAEGNIDDKLVKQVEKIIDDSQRTAFESQLCRALKKPPELQHVAVQKYAGLYASTVPPSTIVPVLWQAAQAVLKAGPPNKGNPAAQPPEAVVAPPKETAASASTTSPVKKVCRR